MTRLEPTDAQRAARRKRGEFSLEKVGKGIAQAGSDFVEGFKQEPLVALALKSLGQTEGANQEGLRELSRRVHGKSASSAAHTIGELAPMLLFAIPGAGFAGLGGRLAIRGVAKKLATKAVLQDVRTAAAATAAAARGGSVGTGLTRIVGTAEKKFLGSKLGQVHRKALDTPENLLAGRKPSIQNTPILQRAAESAGANMAFGGFVAAEEKARGKSDVEALKSAALMVALGGGIDAALVGTTRALFQGARTVDLDVIRAKWIASNAPGKIGKARRVRLTRKDEINVRVRELLNTEAYELELLEEATNQQRLRALLNPPFEKPVRPPNNKQRAEAIRAADPSRTLKSAQQQAVREGKAARKQFVIDTPRFLRRTKLTKETSELLAEKQSLKTVVKNLDEILAAEGTLPYIGTGVSYLGPIKKMWDKMDPKGSFRLKYTTAPESLGGTFGSLGNRVMTQVVRAVTRGEKQGRASEEAFSLWSNTLRKAMGDTQRNWKNGFGKNLDSAEAWEIGGEQGLRDYMRGINRSPENIEEAVGVFKLREAFDWDLYQVQGRKIGAKRAINLRQKGLKKYLTHSSQDLPEDDLVRAMVASGKWTEADAVAKVKAARSHLDPVPVEGIGSGTPARTGPLDFDRLASGSTKKKIREDGIPLNPNVWDSGLRTAQAAHRRIALHPILGDFTAGERGRVFGGTIDELVSAVNAEGFKGPKFRTVLETIAGRTYYNEAMRKAATMMTSVQVAAKLPLAFLANATQPILTTTLHGFQASMKAALSLTKKSTREEFAHSLAIHQHIIRGIGRSVDNEGLVLTSFEKAADYTLRFTGFSMIEKSNRIHAAAAAQVAVRDNLVRAAAGRLRGTRLETARRRLGEMGMNLDELARELNTMGPEAFFANPRYLKLETDSVILGAQKTQFFPGKLRTPSYWSSPIGRVLFQFKTFAVGQSRFMRDVVLTEYSNGNVKPLATILSLAPIAGELVGNARALIKDKDRNDNGIMRYINNFSYVGGLGIVTDALGQARWGNLESVFFGPTFGDILDLGEALASAEGRELWKLIERQTAFQAGKFAMGAGANTTEEILEFMDSMRGEGEGTVTRVEVGDRIIERAREKRER